MLSECDVTLELYCTCSLGCLEIKCPYSIDKNVTVEITPTTIAEKFEEKFFLKKGENGELHLPQEHHYYAQVNGELAVIGRENGAILLFTAMARLLLTEF